MNPLIETWQIHDRINQFMLAAILPEQLALKVERAKSVGGQFSHLHNVRLMWLKSAAPDLLVGLSKLEDADHPTLMQALEASGRAISQLIDQSLVSGKVKGFKPHVQAFVGYLISHESFHRAQAELTLRQLGQPLPDKIAYGMWEWGVR
ncbi:MAG TPA: DinB family protein [Fimbriimonadaceae bacterium]|nr:DinB family protein [Fimbriimonadaceae bacterium]HRJ31953.1 DinB family protein [Fimbriimonadaceae bacterium]